MPGIQLYDKLLQFPLFQGMGRSELMQIISRTKFNFMKFPAGKRIIKEGDKCNNMYLLMNGTIRTVTASDDHNYIIDEELGAPYMIQPECIFGLSQRFRSTVYARTDVNIIAINKKEVVNLSETFIVFRINMINFFASQTQKQINLLWKHRPANLKERIASFIIARCSHPAGHKSVKIRMTQLAEELNDSRLNISIALNSMQDDGLIILSRGMITIPKLEKVILATK
ncbi:Crp/Fnr family transcriptional regulator [Prevotella sp. MGM1]|uniref:Crp/Fnr family transcriptional regulator n=1 Tax=Prevotella sp. MGM1 TaxID=2033405 RepID=UPI000CEA565D|nr:Crp/Fnr family transcriptional regulator [Prevotella sp. MGM1]